ncbi:MAG: hypothetical protein WCI04_03835 [archaeon]
MIFHVTKWVTASEIQQTPFCLSEKFLNSASFFWKQLIAAQELIYFKTPTLNFKLVVYLYSLSFKGKAIKLVSK